MDEYLTRPRYDLVELTSLLDLEAIRLMNNSILPLADGVSDSGSLARRLCQQSAMRENIIWRSFKVE